MSKRRWIVVRNWDKFQHYKDREPPWIKDYTEQLDDPAYLELTGVQRAALQGIRLKYATSRRQVRDDTRLLSRQLNMRITRATLDALNHAGFITFSASSPLAKRKQTASASRALARELRSEENNSPAKTPPPTVPPEVDANDVRNRAFQAYRSHGGNLTLEKERSALAQGVTSLLKAGTSPDLIIYAAGDLGRTKAFPGYLKQRAKEITENGGICRNRGLTRSKLAVAELRQCGCERCADWATALEAQTRAAP